MIGRSVYVLFLSTEHMQLQTIFYCSPSLNLFQADLNDSTLRVPCSLRACCANAANSSSVHSIPASLKISLSYQQPTPPS